MKVSRLEINQLDMLEPLWNKLKEYHQERTIDFVEYYNQNNFAKRKAELLAKDKLALFVINRQNSIAGFCVASFDNQLGEIDSLYVDPAYSSNGAGTLMVEHAIHWLNEQQPKAIRLLVGQGNEAVIEYYEKIGFKKRATVMELFD